MKAVPATKPSYTLAQANAVLQLVRAIAAEFVERRTARRQLGKQREQLEAAATPEGLRSELAELDAQIWAHDEALARCHAELQELGMVVLRPNPLTVHIPGQTRQGEVVFCWQEGEGAVSFGHAPGEEHDQRRPLRMRKGA